MHFSFPQRLAYVYSANDAELSTDTEAPEGLPTHLTDPPVFCSYIDDWCVSILFRKGPLNLVRLHVCNGHNVSLLFLHISLQSLTMEKTNCKQDWLSRSLGRRRATAD